MHLNLSNYMYERSSQAKFKAYSYWQFGGIVCVAPVMKFSMLKLS